jgi:hypothetical protein
MSDTFSRRRGVVRRRWDGQELLAELESEIVGLWLARRRYQRERVWAYGSMKDFYRDQLGITTGALRLLFSIRRAGKVKGW